jgi:hypothetical protein
MQQVLQPCLLEEHCSLWLGGWWQQQMSPGLSTRIYLQQTAPLLVVPLA